LNRIALSALIFKVLVHQGVVFEFEKKLFACHVFCLTSEKFFVEATVEVVSWRCSFAKWIKSSLEAVWK